MKGFGIYVKNDLLDPKHVSSMGPAVWLYMWYLDKITAINDNEIGKVLGGQPIIFEMVRAELGCSDKTYRRWVETLRDAGYINTLRTPTGLVVTLNKAEKIFTNKRSVKSDRSYQEPSDRTKTTYPQSDRSQMGEGSVKSADPNKTIQDNTSITTVTNVTVGPEAVDKKNPEVQKILDSFEAVMDLKMRRQADQRRYAWNLIREHGAEKVVEAIEFYAKARNEYSGVPQALDIKELYYKWNAIKAFFEDISKNKKPRFKRGGGLAVA